MVLAAGDTFRAGAVDQLAVWADRLEVPVVKGKEGGDPSAVVFDAIKKAKEMNADVLICDTAGRLQNKVNLMHELEKTIASFNVRFRMAPMKRCWSLMQLPGKTVSARHLSFLRLRIVTGIVPDQDGWNGQGRNRLIYQGSVKYTCEIYRSG